MRFKHINSVDVSAVFSKDKTYRYILKVTLRGKSGGKKICVIMQNPSYADENEADKSIQFLEKLIFQKNYPEFTNVDTITVVNQFAYIQTNDFEGRKDQIGPENNFHITRALSEADIVLIAWGCSNYYHDRQSEIKAMINFNKQEVFMSVKHPSRGSYKNFIKKFESSTKGS